MNLIALFSQQVKARPQSAAIIESRRNLDFITTFSDLDRRSAKVAALLRQAGVRTGDPVLIFRPISTELYSVLLGVFRLGAVAMFLDPSASREHLERCCELQPPKALIANPKAHLLRLISSALRRIPLKFVFGPWLPGAISLAQADKLASLNGCDSCAPEHPALLTFTSGSTGHPKAAIRTHGFLLAQHRVLESRIKLVPGEVDLTTLPIFLLAHLASGVTSVIPDADLCAPGAIRPEPVLAQMTRHNVTRAAGSPAFFECLLDASQLSTAALHGMHKIYAGGAPVFPRLLDRLCEAAPEAQVEAVYGSTEAEPIAHQNAREIRPRERDLMRRGNGLLAGRPIPEIRLRIIADRWGKSLGSMTPAAFTALQLPTGQIGEIVVTGDHVLKSYLNGHGNTETKFSVGGEVWHRTGDAGKLDPEGRLWLLGRCSAKIKDSRGLVYPFAVECVASEHQAVRRAAFVAHAGKRLLAIEPGEHFDETLLQTLRQDLSWAAVDEVLALKHLPVDKRHNAKIDYPALRELLEQYGTSR